MENVHQKWGKTPHGGARQALEQRHRRLRTQDLAALCTAIETTEPATSGRGHDGVAMPVEQSLPCTLGSNLP